MIQGQEQGHRHQSRPMLPEALFCERCYSQLAFLSVNRFICENFWRREEGGKTRTKNSLLRTPQSQLFSLVKGLSPVPTHISVLRVFLFMMPRWQSWNSLVFSEPCHWGKLPAFSHWIIFTEQPCAGNSGESGLLGRESVCGTLEVIWALCLSGGTEYEIGEKRL